MELTIPALVAQQVQQHRSETILRKKDRGIWNTFSWLTLNERVRELGIGLQSAGMTTGSVIATLSETRPELVFADLAILGMGGISAAIHPETEADEAGDILRNISAICVIVDGEQQLDKLLTVRAGCPDLRLIVIVDMKGLRDFRDAGCVSLSDLIARSREQPDWDQSVAAVQPGQDAVILLHLPGAVRTLTHQDILRQVDQAAAALSVRPGDERLVVLAMSEPAERIVGLYVALKHQVISNYLENAETATENLREVRPTVFGANTEAWEQLHSRVSSLAEAATGTQRAFYHWAISVGAAGGLSALLANILVLRFVRRLLGLDRLRVAYVGDGPLSPKISDWAAALGITVRHLDLFNQGN